MPAVPVQKEKSPLEMDAEEFRKSGHQLVDIIADFLEELPGKRVTTGEQPIEINRHLKNTPLPDEGADATSLLAESSKLLFDHSLFNGHPRFWGYITSSAAPIGALADMLAASVNPNVGAYTLSPMATAIERQTIKWIAEFIGYNENCGGLFVSGGNMANFVGFVTAKKAVRKIHMTKEKNSSASDSKTKEIKDGNGSLQIAYCAKGTHTWIQKAVDIFGDGEPSIRWIETNKTGQIDCEKLKRQIIEDFNNGHQPFLVVGNAGSVGTGIVDPLAELSAISKKNKMWFHVDGAYGAPAAVLPEYGDLFKGLADADSIALDPHKWLYSPLEAGCILVKESQYLRNAFSYHPDYYNFDGQGEDEVLNFHEYGLQNSRGFRALKVWLMLQQAGKKGYMKMIRHDIALAEYLFQKSNEHPQIEAVSQHLSITAFRFVPAGYQNSGDEKYLNQLNENILNYLQKGGKVFVSNAVIDGKYCLRACFVNFRTSFSDIDILIDVVEGIGKDLMAME